MSGGIAYVFDEFGDFASKCNQSMCELEAVLPTADQEESVDETIWHLGETDEFLLRGLIESRLPGDWQFACADVARRLANDAYALRQSVSAGVSPCVETD